MIRSIYVARSGAHGSSPPGDFARMKTPEPDRSLRTAYLSHLFKATEEVPRAGGAGESVLRRVYLAHTFGGTGPKRG